MSQERPVQGAVGRIAQAVCQLQELIKQVDVWLWQHLLIFVHLTIEALVM